MDSVRYRATTRKNKESSYEPTAATVNTAVASRQAPSVGNCENYHPGRRQRTRRRDVYAAPDDFVRVSTLSPAAAEDVTERRPVHSSDVHAKSPTFWAQPTYVAGSHTVTRSRSRPRPTFLLERGVQRGEIAGEYVRNAVESNRWQEPQLPEEWHHAQRRRQRQQQRQQLDAEAGLNPPVEFAARCALDCRPQTRPSPASLLPGRTMTSPTPATSSSPLYSNDNKTLLKEAIMSAAAAKLARSSSARSATVKPLVVIRNGPAKSSSDEHVDADDDVTTTAPKSSLSSDGLESPVTVESAEHSAVIAVAEAATTRRSRTRRRDADQSASGSAATTPTVSGTSPADSAGTRRTRTENGDTAAADPVSQSSVPMPVSGIKMQDRAGFRGTRPVDSGGPPFAATQTSTSCNCDHVDDKRQPAALVTTAASTTHVSETFSKTKKTSNTASDKRKDLHQSTSGAFRTDQDTQRADKMTNGSSVTESGITSAVADAGTHQESPSSMSRVSFIKSILTRTRSPSPKNCRRSRSKVQHASPSPSSVKRLGTEMAQRLSEPVKGYLKHLRDRSSQRRRPAEPATRTANEPEPPARQDRELTSSAVRQSGPGDACPCDGVVDNRSTDDTLSREGRFIADKKKPGGGASALASQWKSTSELTTPMSRLDNLLKANSLQHMKTSIAGASPTNRPPVDESHGVMSSTLSKTSQSTGCLLSSSPRNETQPGQRQRATTMSRCYLEKPPRATRRAMTVQLDRRPTPSLGVSERQSTSHADLRHSQQPLDESLSGSRKSIKHDDVDKQSVVETMTTTTTASASTSSTDNYASSSSQLERNVRELYEQKRLERQLEEKLALMEKERANMIAKLWSQIDRRGDANSTTRQRTTAAGDNLRNSSSSARLVLPLSTPPVETNSQLVDDPLGELLVELSSTPATTRWSERRRGGRTSTATLRPRAASCSRRLVSETPPATTAAAAAGALTSKSKSLSHTQLYRNPSNCSDLARADSSPVHLRHKSQQLLQPASARPLTCYLPVRDRDLDLRRFIETAGHRLDQCAHVQLTSSTCHGYLTKLSAGATVRQWKRRWFVFDRSQRCLQYYADKTEKRTDAAFIWFQTIQDVFVDHERRSRSAHPECTFCVKTVDRPLFLVAPTPETMRIWIDVIFTGAEGYQQFMEQY